MFWSICEKCVPTVTSSRRRKTSKYPQHIVKLGSKCKRLSKCKTTKPSGMLLWRTAQREYMLAIQRFVNNRECTVLQSGDSSAFYRYINQRRACKDGIGLYRDVWIAAIASSRKSLATRTAAICVRFQGDGYVTCTSQCRLRSLRANPL